MSLISKKKKKTVLPRKHSVIECKFIFPSRNAGNDMLVFHWEKQNKTKHMFYLFRYIYIYIRGVNVNVLTHVINLKKFTRFYFFKAN